MAADKRMDHRVFYAVIEAVQGLGYSTMKPEQLKVDTRRFARKHHAF